LLINKFLISKLVLY